MIVAQFRQPLAKTLVAGLVLFLGLNSITIVFAQSDDYSNCQPEPRRLSQYSIKRAPKNVLLVPLLYRNPDFPRENEHWPEPSARIIHNFYRGRFHAHVTWLRNVRSWEAYYRQTDALIQQGKHFDRVIFIAHGGFDGPLLRSEVLREDNMVNGDQAIAQQISEAQPGNQHIVSISYNLNKNKPFSDYVSANWRDLLNTPDGEMRRLLKQKHRELQPMDTACYEKFCSTQQLTGLTEDIHTARLETCERVCRPSLYEAKNYENVSEERFMLFANSLRNLVNEDGLVFMGECNAGTPTPKQYTHWDTPGIVVSSKIAGGPYQNYVHLLSSATGRLVSGPIGRSSANDIVKRIISLEANHEQNFLCIALPLPEAEN